MLDEFTPKPTPPPPSTKSTTAASLPSSEGTTDEDFAKQLQAGMAELMGELESSPDMQSQLEQMLKELGGAAALEGAISGASAPAATSAPKEKSKAAPSASKEKAGTEESFQETIQKTMERMRTSGDSATAAASSSSPEDDILAQMMKAMESGSLDGEGGEEDFSKMLLGMMEQLTNKEILYEPMKELDDKFPAWMEKNEGKVKEEDMKRYREQRVFVREIVGRFERDGYRDEDAGDREYIVERMQKVRFSISL